MKAGWLECTAFPLTEKCSCLLGLMERWLVVFGLGGELRGVGPEIAL